MSEHWKSTPRYWCKHCACYVRDTKLERQNHESTAKHQGALKRFLRELHRGHDREEREKERARQEIARLNGVATGSSSRPSGAADISTQHGGQPATSSEAQLKRQREQLAELGVAVPSSFRPEMALAGEWTVTNTRVVEPDDNPSAELKPEARASGVRKREETEEEREEEDAVRSLFKKPRRWGRDSKTMPQETDEELDALLGGTILPPRRAADDKPKADIKDEAASDDVKAGVTQEKDTVKQEPDDSVRGLPQGLQQGLPGDVKTEEIGADAAVKTEDIDPARDTTAPVVFKKRNSKGIRQK